MNECNEVKRRRRRSDKSRIFMRRFELIAGTSWRLGHGLLSQVIGHGGPLHQSLRVEIGLGSTQHFGLGRQLFCVVTGRRDGKGGAHKFGGHEFFR